MKYLIIKIVFNMPYLIAYQYYNNYNYYVINNN